MTIVITGGSGFIGKHIVKELNKKNLHYVLSSKRIYNYNDVLKDIEFYHPKFIISAAGYSTPTTIDFYENNKENLILTNTIGNLILADLSSRHNIHLTLIMSGCIYQYKKHFEEYINYYSKSNIYKESDIPNFNGSFYSQNRIETENILKNYKNICILRLRMPISSNLHPKSLITKIINYRNIINIPNSMSVLDDLMPFIIIAMNKKLYGVYNLVNKGTISHPDILRLYKILINPSYKYKVITEHEQNIRLLALRSNCHLSCDKISKYMHVPDIFTSVKSILIDMKYITNKYHLF